MSQTTDDQLLKNEPCFLYEQDGSCRFGLYCKYAHGPEEIGTPILIDPKQQSALSSHPLYKTTLCSYWVKNGACKHVATCSFAHGEHELRAPGHSYNYPDRRQEELPPKLHNVQQFSDEKYEYYHEQPYDSYQVYQEPDADREPIPHSSFARNEGYRPSDPYYSKHQDTEYILSQHDDGFYPLQPGGKYQSFSNSHSMPSQQSYQNVHYQQFVEPQQTGISSRQVPYGRDVSYNRPSKRYSVSLPRQVQTDNAQSYVQRSRSPNIRARVEPYISSKPLVSQQDDPRFKTEMCKFWEQHGFCKVGDRCTYAHSRQELRSKRSGPARREESYPQPQQQQRGRSQSPVGYRIR